MSRDASATLGSEPLTLMGDGGGASTASYPPPKRRYEACPNSAGWLHGVCEHGNQRWVRLRCKRRDCPVCGKIRKELIAYRIRFGIEHFGGPSAWFVGTWTYDVPKPYAVKTQQLFIRWLRRDMGIPVEYASVWEQHRSGRLHLNLVLSPWQYIPQRLLSEKWRAFGGGPIVWIEYIEPGIEQELSKLRIKFSNYLAKFEQMVKEGRGINYSKGWPKIPSNPMQRRGLINWYWYPSWHDDVEQLEQDIDNAFYLEVQPGEYTLAGELETCDCFQYTLNNDLRAHRARDDPS